MKSRFSKIISLALVIVMLVQLTPMSVFAAGFKTGEPASIAAVAELNTETAGKKEFTAEDVLEEESSLREETVKHFRMSDGSFVAVDYGYAVHYKDENGEYQDIDNSLVASAAPATVSLDGTATAPQITTTDRENNITFASNSTDNGALVTIGDGDKYVKMSPYALMPVNAGDVELAAEETNNLEIAEGIQAGELTSESGSLDASAVATPGFSAYVEEITEGVELNKLEGISTIMATDEAAAVLANIQPLQLSSVAASIDNAVQVAAEEESFAEAVIPEKSMSSLLYSNIFPDVDIEYNLLGNNVKENIIVKKAADSYIYPFVVELANTMTMELQDDGSILIYDGTDPVYEICAPYMYDDVGESSFDVSYIVKELGNGKYILTTVADAEWINAEGRRFPVVIDPSVNAYTSNHMQVTYICSTYPSSNLSYDSSVYIGRAYNGAKYRTVLRVNVMPTLPTGSTVVGANLNFTVTEYSFNGESELDIHALPITNSSFWNAVSWNNCPNPENIDITDYVKVGRYAGSFSLDVTREYLKWCEDASTNNGLIIYTPEENTMKNTWCSFVRFYKSAGNPMMVINYRNTMGVEDYYTYQTQDIGRAGTAYVGDYSGGITLVNNISTSASTVAPLSIGLVYNSAMANNLYQDFVYSYDRGFLGGGWKLTCMQSVHTSDDETRLVYIDGDGTTHYFAWDAAVGKYVDEDGLGLFLAKDGYNYTMTDRYGGSKYFHSNMLNMETDANGNQINYDVSENRIIGIYRQRINPDNPQGPIQGRVLLYTLTYDPYTYNLTSITDSANNVTSFTYNEVAGMQRLTGITFPDSKTVTYSYYDDGRLKSATDNESGYSVEYEYHENGRVSTIQEKSGDTAGTKIIASGTSNGLQAYCYPGADQKVSRNDYFNENAVYTCGCASTEVCNCDDDNILTYCVFDYYGRTVNTYSTNATGSVIYGVDYTKYVTNTGTSGGNNRINTASSVGVQPENYAVDGGFENGNGVINNSSGCAITRDSSVVHTGGYSLKVSPSGESEATAIGSVSGLSSGTYIVSAYVRFTEGGEGSATISNGTTSGPRMKNTSSGSEWERIYVAANTTNGVLNFEIAVDGGSDVYVDDIQIEPCVVGQDGAPSGVNLLSNGNFKVANSGWGTFTTEDVHFDRGEGSFTAAKLVGDANETRQLTQRVPINLDAGQTYMLSAWAKASSSHIESVEGFGLIAVINYEGGATETHEEAFCVDYEGWQYLAMPIVPKETAKVESIDVTLSYNNNTNTAYFAKAALVREVAASYKYNSNGDLVASNVTDNAEQTYTYSSNHDLIGQTTKGSGEYAYTYDGRHNITGVSHDTTEMTIQYDDWGNAELSILTSDEEEGLSITSSTDYTLDHHRVDSVTDARGKVTEYTYDGGIYTLMGVPSAVTDAKGTTVTTTRNGLNGRVAQSAISGEVTLAYGYNTDGTLSTITRNSHAPGSTIMTAQIYNLGYTANFDRLQSVAVGGKTIASYVYDNNGSGLLERMNYGNGDFIEYSYDVLERLSQTSYNDRGSVNYYYNGMGALGKVKDNETGRSYYYNYDSLGRLISMTEENGGNGVQSYSASYDNANRLSGFRYSVSPAWNDTFGALRTFSYTYSDTDGTLTELNSPSGKLTYEYDGFNRLSGRTAYAEGENGAALIEKEFSYLAGAENGTTTTLVGGLTNLDGSGNTISSFVYGYDDVGNIVSISGGGESRSYTYDAQGQMLTETIGDTTYTYSYDTAGNILSISDGSETISYIYGDADWKDLLTQYGDLSITYDDVGNPTNWRGIDSLTWESGKRLMAATIEEGPTISYTYDMDGLRLSKTVGSTEHKYVWQGSRLISETYGTKALEFFYDESGVPYAFYFADSADATNDGYYYYVTNLQGDVIGILDADGNTVGSYSYNAWGAPISVTDSDESGLVNINPLRYRGYYYDSESGLYYLQSRYYDPEVCRFINADEYASTGQGFIGCNMFAYCNNNPVNYVDSEGLNAESATLWASSMWWLHLVDGPIPVGDIIYWLVLVAIAIEVITVGNLVSSQVHSEASKPEEASNSSKNDEVTSQNPPTEEDGYIAPKGGPKRGKTKDGKQGWVDSKGNIWVPAPSGSARAHGGGHWDVQRGDGNGYVNVYPGGKLRPGKGKMPSIPLPK